MNWKDGGRGRASCAVDNVSVWFPDVGETLGAVVSTARDDGWILG